jgi:hypothetical protein
MRKAIVAVAIATLNLSAFGGAAAQGSGRLFAQEGPVDDTVIW